MEVELTTDNKALIKAVEVMEAAANQTTDVNTFKILQTGFNQIKEVLKEKTTD